MQHEFSQNMIAGFNDRNAKAVALMCKSYYPVVEAKVKKFTGGSPDDKDLTGDIWVRFLDRCPEVATIKNLEKYLNKVVAGICEDDKRKKKTRQMYGPVVSEHLSNLHLQNMENQNKRLICAYLTRLAVEMLPNKSRRVFLMSYIDEMTSRQIAAEMNISPRTVEKHKSEAYIKLRLEFDKREGDIGRKLLFVISVPLLITYLLIQKLLS